MKKRGQVTLLVIIGLVLLFSVLLILSFRQTFFDHQLQAQAKSSVSSFLEISSLEQYITSCLNTVLYDGLFLLSTQGGYIYDYQGGLIPTSDFIEGTHYMPYKPFPESPLYQDRVVNLSYAITDYVDCPGAYINPTPARLDDEITSYYPVRELFLKDYLSTYQSLSDKGCISTDLRVSRMSGYLGYNRFPKLCSYNGSNRQELANSCAIAHYDNPQEPTSIQRQLEHYIEQTLLTCVNLDEYQDQLANYNITLNESTIKATVTFQRPKGMIATVNLPFDVRVRGSQSVIRLVTFQTRIDISLRQFYNWMYEVFFTLVSKPEHNTNSDLTTITGLTIPSTYSYEKKSQDCFNCQAKQLDDDVLIFTDASTLLEGQPLSFHFAIRQRKPVLDYLHDASQSSSFNQTRINYLFYTNSTLELQPRGMDPDGDAITYTYYGWKEDYTTFFNQTCCAQKKCTLETHYVCLVRTEDIFPKELSSSKEYQVTKRSTRIETTDSDVGYHEIQVVIEDEHGAKDFQIIRLLIFDLPRAEILTKNFYADINDSWASVEDRYLLDGSKSIVSRLLDSAKISGYYYQDSVDNFEIKTDQSLYTLFPAVDISTVVDNYFKKTTHKNNPTTNTITLVVEQEDGAGNVVASAPARKDIYVADCLPHQYDSTLTTSNKYPAGDNTNDQNLYSYWQATDPFYLPHVCCEPQPVPAGSALLKGGDIKDDTEVCFNTDDLKGFYTCHPLDETLLYQDRALLVSAPNAVAPVSESAYNAQYGPNAFEQDFYDSLRTTSTTDDRLNDLYSVTYTQYCDGTRGNVCGGKVSASWTTLRSCADYDSRINQFARCAGPGVNNRALSTSCVGANLAVSPYNHGVSDLTCYQYPTGNSFEKDFLGLTKQNSPNLAHIGLIEKGYCAPSIAANIDYTQTSPTVTAQSSGPYECYGTCNGNGVCDYTSYTACACVQGSSVCQGISAVAFADTTHQSSGFVCVGASACSGDCQEKPTTTPESCYCQTKSSTDPNKHSYASFDASQVEAYFDATYPYLRNGANTPSTALCCTEGTTLVTQNKNGGRVQSAAPVCADGVKYASGKRFSTSQTKANQLLSCNGRILCCGDITTCPSSPSVLLNSTTSRECGFTCSSDNSWK